MASVVDLPMEKWALDMAIAARAAYRAIGLGIAQQKS
jgi:hypothetical protein